MRKEPFFGMHRFSLPCFSFYHTAPSRCSTVLRTQDFAINSRTSSDPSSFPPVHSQMRPGPTFSPEPGLIVCPDLENGLHLAPFALRDGSDIMWHSYPARSSYLDSQRTSLRETAAPSMDRDHWQRVLLSSRCDAEPRGYSDIKYTATKKLAYTSGKLSALWCGQEVQYGHMYPIRWIALLAANWFARSHFPYSSLRQFTGSLRTYLDTGISCVNNLDGASSPGTSFVWFSFHSYSNLN